MISLHRMTVPPSIALFAIALVGCREGPASPVMAREVQPTAMLAERRDPGVPMATVYFTTISGAPGNQRAALASMGGRSFSGAYPGFPTAVTIPRSRLAEMRNAPWIRILEVDSTRRYRPAGDLGRASPAASLFTESVPWGVASIGAATVHSSLGITGAGIKVAVLDHGPRVSHSDLSTFTACRDVPARHQLLQLLYVGIA